MKMLVVTFAIVGLFLYINPTFAEMTSTNYKIRWDSVTAGGSDTSSSTSYQLRDSVSGSEIGTGSSTNYQISSGFRAGIYDQIITFDTVLQNVGDEREVTSLSGLTISLSNTSNIAVDDYVALIQDAGASQVSAFGKVTAVSSGSSVTVDAWATNGTTPTIDGAGDRLSRMNASSVGFGNLSVSNVSTALVGFRVSAELQNGYVVQLMEDGDLRAGTDSINDVTDGSVTAGSEEYGARSSDTSLTNSTFDTTDTAISSTFQDVATESSAIFEDRTFVTLKTAISSSSANGTYSHSISLVAAGNF